MLDFDLGSTQPACSNNYTEVAPRQMVNYKTFFKNVKYYSYKFKIHSKIK